MIALPRSPDKPGLASEAGRPLAMGVLLGILLTIAASHGACLVLVPLDLVEAKQSYWAVGAVVGAASIGSLTVRAFAYRWLPRMTAANWLRLAALGVAAALLGYAALPPGLWLAPLRFIQGLGFGLALLVCMSCIAEQSDPPRRSFGFALAGGAISTGLVLGPALGFYLGHLEGSAFAFVACAAAVVTMSLSIGRMGRTVSHSCRGNLSWGGANLLALAACLLSGAILGYMEAFIAIVAEQRHLGSIPVIVGVFAGTSLVGRFLPGMIAGRIGSGGMLIAGTGGAALALLAVGVLLYDPVTTVLLSALLGTLVGVLHNASITFVSLRTPVAGQASALGILGIGSDLGLTFGAALGGASMAMTGEWTAGLLVISAVLAIVAIQSARLMPSSAAQLDVIGGDAA